MKTFTDRLVVSLLGAIAITCVGLIVAVAAGFASAYHWLPAFEIRLLQWFSYTVLFPIVLSDWLGFLNHDVSPALVICLVVASWTDLVRCAAVLWQYLRSHSHDTA